MVKSNKMSKKIIAIIMLSLLLALSMIMGITGAWFTDKVDFPDKQSQTLGFGRVDINQGTGESAITYTIYEKTAENKDDYLQLVDGDKITIADNLNVVNNSNVDILYVVKKTLGVEVTAGATDLADLTKENVLSWLKKGGPNGTSLAEMNDAAYGSLASGETFPALQNSYNGDYVVDSQGNANALKVEGTFKITITAHVYAVQKGYLEGADNAATWENVKNAFQAVGFTGWTAQQEQAYEGVLSNLGLLPMYMNIQYTSGSDLLTDKILVTKTVTSYIISSSTLSKKTVGGVNISKSSIKTIAIPSGVTMIATQTFVGCSNLTSISIPNSVTYIAEGAFSGCSNLTSISIPNSVTYIGERAFSGCSGLTSINIPNDVTTIRRQAFSGCTNLTSISIPNSVTTIGYQAFCDCSGLTSITIPDGVTKIEANVFQGCSGLTSITIPDSVEWIQSQAFSGCRGLTSITIPSSVTTIAEGAFYGCSGLTSIVVESGNTKYDSRDNCNAIIEKSTNKLVMGCQNTVIPNSVTSIGKDAFSGCTNLTSISIPNSIEIIEKDAFRDCNNLATYTDDENASSGIRYLGNESNNYVVAYKLNDKTLTGYTLNSNTKVIYPELFKDCDAVDEIWIPGVTSIGSYAFSGSSIKSLYLPERVIIGEYAFSGCDELEGGIEIEYGTTIGRHAFENCYKLGSVWVWGGSKATTIAEGAFYGCSNLTSFMVTSDVPSTLGSGAFDKTNEDFKITVPSDSVDAYKAAEGWSDYADRIEAE